MLYVTFLRIPQFCSFRIAPYPMRYTRKLLMYLIPENRSNQDAQKGYFKGRQHKNTREQNRSCDTITNIRQISAMRQKRSEK